MNWFVKLMISIGITIAGWCAIDIVFQLLDGGTLSTSFARILKIRTALFLGHNPR